MKVYDTPFAAVQTFVQQNRGIFVPIIWKKPMNAPSVVCVFINNPSYSCLPTAIVFFPSILFTDNWDFGEKVEKSPHRKCVIGF